VTHLRGVCILLEARTPDTPFEVLPVNRGRSHSTFMIGSDDKSEYLAIDAIDLGISLYLG
jgi:hypothetical protein